MLCFFFQLVEGAAAVCVAAYTKSKSDHNFGKNIVLVMCGANVGIEALKGVIDKNIM